MKTKETHTAMKTNQSLRKPYSDLPKEKTPSPQSEQCGRSLGGWDDVEKTREQLSNDARFRQVVLQIYQSHTAVGRDTPLLRQMGKALRALGIID